VEEAADRRYEPLGGEEAGAGVLAGALLASPANFSSQWPSAAW
jgi:hypothetical protein